MPFIALALLIAAALGGGASVAAQSSLPGDALWGFKVGINENVQAALAAEGKAQADFDIAAIEARMNEAAQLSANAHLTADTQAQLESNFNSHVESVQEQIARLEERGDYAAAADVAARFQAAVATHASALAEARTNAGEPAKPVLSGIINRVQATLDVASNLSAEASAKAAANASDSNSDSTGAGASGSVHTGTSVQGGSGGIKVDSDTGVQIGI